MQKHRYTGVFRNARKRVPRRARGATSFTGAPLFFVGTLLRGYQAKLVHSMTLLMYYYYQRMKWRGKNTKLLNSVFRQIARSRQILLTHFCTTTYRWSLHSSELHSDVLCAGHQPDETYVGYPRKRDGHSAPSWLLGAVTAQRRPSSSVSYRQ